MAPADRKRAGFVLGGRVAVGMYGDTFHAEGAGRRDLHALVVDASIAAEPGVASLLLDEVVPALRALEHRAVVGTIGAARDQGDLIVVTEPLPEHVTLHEVLTAARGSSARLPQEIAAAIARAVIDAVATAHAAGLVHGAIHPRSVLIDAKGDVSLADFAIGRTVTTAVARGASPDLTRPLVGYLAPDLAIGDEPSPASDVFALGALVFAMITGELPPGTLDTTPAVERLVQRALDTDLARRFGSAIELQENFAEALEDDRWYTATPAELARFVARHRAGGDAVDAATEDLLASLAATSDPPTRGTLDAAAVQDLLVGPSTGVTAVGSDTGSLDAVIESLAPHAEDDGDEPLTQVDGATAALQGERDPISEMIEIERARTGEEPVPEVEPPRHRSGERARRIGTEARRADAAAAAAAVIDDLDGLDDVDAAAGDVEAPRSGARRPAAAPAARAAVPMPDLEGSVPGLRPAGRGLTGLVWLLVILAAGAALVWVIMDLRTKSADQERRNRAAAEASRKKTEQLEAELADPGAIRITSSPDYAAVWLLLARTPGTSFALPTGQLHELRVELDGHQPVDLQVTAKEWVRQGPDTLAEANLTVALQPGAPATPVKAMPDAPPPELARGLIAGRGVIHVESTPPGAAVWLLVGQTNEMKLEGIEAGRDYDLRVTKDGYLPSYVHISAEEWRSGGDPNLPLAAAPKHGMIERSVELLPDPAAKGEAAKGGRRRAKGSP